MDMSQFIIAKSDQLNGDDLIGGPITVTITEMRGNDSADQPVSVCFDGDDGKPFKPCKSMRRVMVAAWGLEAKKYVGQRMTLFRDPDVQFGGMKLGGIRISHMSGLKEKLTVALQVTRGKKGLYTVLPLAGETPPAQTSDFSGQLAELKALAQPGNMDALGAKWKEIGADARKALAAELPALKAACDTPAEDVPFDAETGEVIETPKPRTLGEQLDEPHPGTAIADRLVEEIRAHISVLDISTLMAERAADIEAMLPEDGARVEIVADKRKAEIRESQKKAKEPAE